MVSTTDVDGDKKPNSSANWKKNKPKTAKSQLKGAATSDSVLHQKVVTNGSDQAGQLLTLGNALISHVWNQQLPSWAESLRNNVRKTQADFIPARIRKTNYGTADVNPGDPFVWNAPAIDSKEDYVNDLSVWKIGQVSGKKQYQNYTDIQ